VIKKYRKKPVEIEALQWNGNNSEMAEFLNIPNLAAHTSYGRATLQIYSLEGEMTAQFGDYIIKGIKGEFYPCKPDIFKATYEEIKE
jgi:hypothetical protein